MNATLLYRIVACVFVVTAMGHTYSILNPPPTLPWAFLSWHLRQLACSGPGAIGALGWAFLRSTACRSDAQFAVFSFAGDCAVGDGRSNRWAVAAWLVGR
jgi:hypothetical protein